MLVDGKRELAYIQTVHDIEPIVGADNIEKIHVLGWDLIAKKENLKKVINVFTLKSTLWCLLITLYLIF